MSSQPSSQRLRTAHPAWDFQEHPRCGPCLESVCCVGDQQSYTCMCLYDHVYIYMYICIYVYMCIFVYVYMCMCICICICICMCKKNVICMCICRCSCTYMIYIYICVYERHLFPMCIVGILILGSPECVSSKRSSKNGLEILTW